MRVITGSLKGRPIYYLKNSVTRPLKDAVRENIFNILKHSKLINIDMEQSNILDLYSGIGSFGIECLSRGAKKVTFIEQNKNAVNILKKNLTKLNILERSTVYHDKIENILKHEKEKYNIFFFDPPFLNKNFLEIFKLIKKNRIFFKKNIIVIHRDNKTKDTFENYINIVDTKRYGRSKIIFAFFN